MNDSQPIVTATDLRRRYGEGDTAVDALDGVDLAFQKGRFNAIMGPSGSGKSTLMHILAGLDRPTSGSVVLDGTELNGLDDDDLTQLRRDKLGFIFQFFNLLPVLTAEENIVLPLSIAGREPDPEFLKRLVETVGLSDRLTHRPVRAVGRPAAAGGRRARARLAPRGRVRGRAHRQPRLEVSSDEVLQMLRAGRRRVRPDRGDGHPRRTRGLVRRPADRAAGRKGGA